jgi:general stress protein 26
MSMRLLGPPLIAVALLAAPARAQQTQLTRERALDVVRQTMMAAEYCFLITLDDGGQPQARLMDPFEPEPDMTIWMATDRATRKVGQIRSDPRATMACHDAAGMGYATLMGTARLVDDEKERAGRWKPEWEEFYPEGPTGPHYILIEFRPASIEVMSIALGVAHGPFGPARLRRRGDGWALEPR